MSFELKLTFRRSFLPSSSPRPKIAILRKDELLDQFSLICSDIAVHSFKHVKTVKQAKDGGVFVRFTYVPEEKGGSEKALTEVEKAFNEAATKLGGLKTWSWMGGGKVWRVLGRPWHEVSSRRSFEDASRKEELTLA